MGYASCIWEVDFVGLARAAGAWGPGDDGFRAQQELRVAGCSAGLIGLMDGSVSTLAPLFAVAFATQDTQGDISGRARGCGRGGDQHGLLGGALGRWVAHRARESAVAGDHNRRRDVCRGDLAYPAVPHTARQLALYVAFGVVGVELLAISFIRYRYFDMSFLMSAVQVSSAARWSSPRASSSATRKHARP